MHSLWEDSRSRVTANIQNDTYQVLIVPFAECGWLLCDLISIETIGTTNKSESSWCASHIIHCPLQVLV